MKKSFILYFTIALCLTTLRAQNPGIKVTIGPDAVDNFNKVLLPVLIQKLDSIQVNDINSTNLNITNMVISQINLPGPSITSKFQQDNFLVSTDNFGLEVSFHFQYKVMSINVIDLNLSATVSGSSLAFSSSFSFTGQNVNVNLNSFGLTIRNLDLHFPSGVVNTVMNLITKLFKGSLQNLISSQLSNAIEGVVQDSINQVLNTIPGSGGIPGTNVGVYYSPVSAPTINPNAFSVGLNGTFYDSTKGFSVPPVPLPDQLPEFDSTIGSSVQIFVSSYTLNTGLYMLWQNGVFNIKLNDSVMPPDAGFALNVDFVQEFIPNVTQYFNSNDSVEIDFQATGQPISILSKGDFMVHFNVIFTILVKNSSGEYTVATLAAFLNTHGNITVNNWIVKPFISVGSFSHFQVIQSNVGQINPKLFNDGFNTLLEVILPIADAAIVSFPLPSIPYIDLNTTSVDIEAGYIKVSANPVF